MRDALRRLFARWGLPGELRVDNGAPWGSWGDLPPDLALWLLGLGVGVHWNRPHRCRENAVIERAHGVCQRWAEPGGCPDAAALQARLDRATALQRERYPAVGGASRAAAYPGLAAGGRPYDPAREAERWDERRAWRALAGRVWRRRVDKVGRVSLYNRAVAVGRRHAGAEVLVRLDAADGSPAWVVADAAGTVVARRPAPELGRGRILALDVARRRPGRRRGAEPDAR